MSMSTRTRDAKTTDRATVQRARHAMLAAVVIVTLVAMPATVARPTFACTSPVLGLKTSPVRPEVALTDLPPMKPSIARILAFP